MLLNEFGKEMRSMSVVSGISKSQAAKEAGVSTGYATDVAKRRVVNPVFVKLCEVFGYDVRVEYVKRDSGP